MLYKSPIGREQSEKIWVREYNVIGYLTQWMDSTSRQCPIELDHEHSEVLLFDTRSNIQLYA